MNWSRYSRLPKLLLSLMLAMAPLAHADAQSFGRVGAVNLDATGTPPRGTAHELTLGGSIVVKERVRTSTAGSTQILFPDQSSLNVGANSDMVVDEYYYNPKAETGNIVASATKGVLRYVGGHISHTSGATITTPSAVLGIRGGIVTVMLPLPPSLAASDPSLAGLSGELVIAHFGTITVKNNVSQIVLPPGFATVVGSANTPILPPFRLSDATLQNVTRTLTSRPGQTGGATNIPTNQSVSLPQGFAATFLPNPGQPPGTDPLGYTSIFGAGNSLIKNKSQTNQPQSVHPSSPCSSVEATGAPWYMATVISPCGSSGLSRPTRLLALRAEPVPPRAGSDMLYVFRRSLALLRPRIMRSHELV